MAIAMYIAILKKSVIGSVAWLTSNRSTFAVSLTSSSAGFARMSPIRKAPASEMQVFQRRERSSSRCSASVISWKTSSYSSSGTSGSRENGLRTFGICSERAIFECSDERDDGPFSWSTLSSITGPGRWRRRHARCDLAGRAVSPAPFGRVQVSLRLPTPSTESHSRLTRGEPAPCFSSSALR
jgi:hypothetical protein